MEGNQDVSTMRIAVVGAGSWGTALANLLAVKGYVVDWWVFEEDLCQQLKEIRENPVFLPGITLSENLRPTNDLAQAVRNKDLVLVVVPSHVVRHVIQQMAGHIGSHTILVSASKGIENDTQLTMAGVISQDMGVLNKLWDEEKPWAVWEMIGLLFCPAQALPRRSPKDFPRLSRLPPRCSNVPGKSSMCLPHPIFECIPMMMSWVWSWADRSRM